MEPKWIATELDQDIPQLSWEESLSDLLSTSPEIARAVAEMKGAQCALARAQAGRIPNVELEAGASYNFASEDPVATVRVAVPLQLYNRNQGNIMQAQAELAAAQQEVSRVRLALQERLAEAFRQYSAAGQQVDRYTSDILRDARESLNLALQAYREGELAYLDLLTTQRTFFQTSLAYIDALRTLRISAARIEGLLLDGGLVRAGK
jgi:cobalt-zinc-cadmium efflux system outer membrane protein